MDESGRRLEIVQTLLERVIGVTIFLALATALLGWLA